MTHDPLCPRSEDHHNHGAHADTVRHFCLCLVIAQVRADERKRAAQRISSIELKGSPFDGGYHDGYRDALDHAEQEVTP